MNLGELMDSPSFKLGVKLLIVALLVIILYNVVELKKKEHMILSYSAGADQRSMMQEFSGTNQRPYETGYNDQIIQQLPIPGVSQAQINLERRLEHMAAIPTSQAQEEALAAALYNSSNQEHMAPDTYVRDEIAEARSYSA